MHLKAPVAPTQEPFLRVHEHKYSNVLAALSSVGPPQNFSPYSSYISVSEINLLAPEFGI